MNNNCTAAINFNKEKLKLKLIILSCIMVLFPYQVFTFLLPFIKSVTSYNQLIFAFIVFVVAVFLVVYYYLFLLFKAWLNKYQCKKPVLIINENGITDKICTTSLGFVPWSNIKKVSALASSEHYLVLFIEDPQALVNKFKKASTRKRLMNHFKKNGSNIRIAIKPLDGNVYTLKKIAQAQLSSFKNKMVQNQSLVEAF